MKEIHLEKQKISEVKNEKEFKLYDELTLDDIDLLKKLEIKYLDLSNLSNTSFPDYAFFSFKSLISIILPYGLKSVGKGCFCQCYDLENVDAFNCLELNLIEEGCFVDCLALKNIKLPNTITVIGAQAFGFCLSLNTILLPNSVEIIKKFAFNSCISLKSINLPNSIYSIELGSFNLCNKLETVCLPLKLKKIESKMFFCYNSLKTINIADSIQEIEDCAFHRCKSLTELIITNKNKNFCVDKNVLFNKNKTILYLYFSNEEYKNEYKIPDTVETIKPDAFFNSCLKSIVLPKSVFTIGKNAFCCQKNLTSFTFGYNENLKDFSESMFLDCCLLKHIIIPKNVKKIGSNVFSGCSSLEAIIIPKSVTSLGKNVFANCKSLIFVKFENGTGINEIPSNAFKCCCSLKKLLCQSLFDVFHHLLLLCVHLYKKYIYIMMWNLLMKVPFVNADL